MSLKMQNAVIGQYTQPISPASRSYELVGPPKYSFQLIIDQFTPVYRAGVVVPGTQEIFKYIVCSAPGDIVWMSSDGRINFRPNVIAGAPIQIVGVAILSSGIPLGETAARTTTVDGEIYGFGGL